MLLAGNIARRLLLVVLLGVATQSLALAAGADAVTYRVYCVGIAGETGRTADIHYKLRACPAAGGDCTGEWQSFVLDDASRRTTPSSTHCRLSAEPVLFSIAYDYSAADSYDEVLQDIVPFATDWRGLFPDAWCLRDAFVHFTHSGSRLTLAPGCPNRIKIQRCSWYEPEPKGIAPDSGLPPSLTGAWASKADLCPAPTDRAARRDDVVWIQPHAVERGSETCLLSGKFLLGSSFTADALCPSKNGFDRSSFTFDRLKDGSMRMREGRGKRQGYVRCSDSWLPDPRQLAAAARVKGPARHPFEMDITSELKREDGGRYDGSHKRKIELVIGGNGVLTDSYATDTGFAKTFVARPGEVVLDSDGDRAVWQFSGERISRLRERRGYYEIFSWPLNFFDSSVECAASLSLVSTRRDGKNAAMSSDGTPYEVLSASVAKTECPQPDGVGTPFETGDKPEPSGKLAEFKISDDTDKGICAGAAKDADRAIAACTRLIDQAGASATPESFGNRGSAYLGKKQFDLARADLDKAIELDPKDWSALNNRGLLRLATGDNDGAVDDFGQVVALSPHFQGGYEGRGKAYLALGQYWLAIRDFDKVLRELDKGNEKIAELRKQALTAAMGLAPNKDIDACNQDADPKLRQSGCAALIASGKLDGVNLGWANINYGLAGVELGIAAGKKSGIEAAQPLFTDAVDHFIDAATADPKNPTGFAKIAQLLLEVYKNYDAVGKWLDRADQVSPDDEQICYLRAGLYDRRGEQQKMADQVGRCLTLAPSPPPPKISFAVTPPPEIPKLVLADGCVRPSMQKRQDPKNDRLFELKMDNACEDRLVVRATHRWLNPMMGDLQPNYGEDLSAYLFWGVTLGGTLLPEEFLNQIELHALKESDYEATCGPYTGTPVEVASRCFSLLLAQATKSGSQATSGPDETKWDIGSAELWCEGAKAGNGRKSVDACTYLIGVGIINPADGSMDQRGTSRLYFLRGLTLARMGKLAESVPDFDRAIELDASAAHLFHYRSLAHEDLGHTAEAASDRKRACSMDKEFCK